MNPLKIKLAEFLNNRVMLRDEKRMWYKLGLYIYPDDGFVDARTNQRQGAIRDNQANLQRIDYTIANNLRMSIFEWWDEEKKKPRAEEIGKVEEISPFDALENRNG
jgi:hypothetical protein